MTTTTTTTAKAMTTTVAVTVVATAVAAPSARSFVAVDGGKGYVGDQDQDHDCKHGPGLNHDGSYRSFGDPWRPRPRPHERGQQPRRQPEQPQRPQ